MSHGFRVHARRLGIIFLVWASVHLFGAIFTYLWLLSSGEATPRLDRLWLNVIAIPLWVLLTPPILRLSRRFPVDRQAWGQALGVHATAIAAVVAFDGAVSMLATAWLAPQRSMSYGRHILQYAFFNVFFYLGIMAVEHASRYYHLYVERRVRAAELEAQLIKSQLFALQMQLQPHFFFNTLNTISGLIRMNENDTAIRMVAGLGELLRAVLRSDGTHEVPVGQELHLIEQYLRIEQVRFEERLQVEVTVARGVDRALVPKLILQPLVENAVRHGICPDGTRGRVAIHVERRAEVLRLEVHNSGRDVEPEAEAAEGGIGWRNTRARLERLYGPAHLFEFSRTETGAIAVIEVPFHLAPAPAA